MEAALKTVKILATLAGLALAVTSAASEAFNTISAELDG